MPELNLNTYIRQKVPQNGLYKIKTFFKDNYSTILECILMFFTARAVVLDSLLPFATAFYGSVFSRKNRYFISAFALAALFTLRHPVPDMLKYIITMAVIFVLFSKFEPFFARSFINRGIGTSCALIVGTLSMGLLKQILIYDVFVLLLEILITFVGVIAVDKAMPLFYDIQKRRYMSSEEIISFAIMLSVVILGSGDLLRVGGISICNIISIMIIMIFALRYGATASSAAGVTVGIVAGITGSNFISIAGAYAFSGLVCGLFSKAGKAAVAFSFILANALITLYTNGSTEVLINIYEIFAAALLFLAIPKKAIDYISGYAVETKRKSNVSKIKDSVSLKLKKISNSFGELSRSLLDLREPEISRVNSHAAIMFERTAKKVCKTCGLKTYCWSKEFISTYNSMINMLEKIEETGRLHVSDIPVDICKYCLKREELAAEFSNMYELYKIDRLWSSKIDEMKSAMSKQLVAIAKITNNLSRDMKKGMNFDIEAENELAKMLDKERVKYSDVSVVHNSSDALEVTINVERCGNHKACEAIIGDMIKKITGRNLKRIGDKNCSNCVLTFVEAPENVITVASASETRDKHKQCGDSYSLIQLSDSKFCIVLSDGMGTGAKAAKESGAVVNMMREMLISGFDLCTSVGIVNSILVSGTSENNCTTIDVAMIDTRNSDVCFIKTGAAAGFIKRSDSVEVINSDTLPAGVFNNIEIEMCRRSLNDGDIIIMVTDGVLEADKESINKEQWLVDEIGSAKYESLDAFANAIIKKAKELSGEKCEDDMTVIATKYSKIVFNV